MRISDRAVARIVAAAAASVPGTTELGRSLERIAGRTYPRFDVLVDDTARTCSVEAYIAVTWPSPVTDVAEAVRSTISTWVREYTGLTVTTVNVVTGPVVAAPRVTTVAPTRPTLRPVTVAPLRVTHPVAPPGEPLRPVTVAPPVALRPVTVTPTRRSRVR